jgi:hypothetical protein
MVAVASLAGALALLAGCGGHGHPAAGPTTTAPDSTRTVPATTTPPTPPTTPSRSTSPPTTAWRATAPQPSAEGAADDLVSDWAIGNRAGARTLATPAAVAALFAAPYPGEGLAIARGCSDDFGIVCAYGPPGGANPNDALYELTMYHGATGWFVGSVDVEG